MGAATKSQPAYTPVGQAGKGFSLDTVSSKVGAWLHSYTSYKSNPLLLIAGALVAVLLVSVSLSSSSGNGTSSIFNLPFTTRADNDEICVPVDGRVQPLSPEYVENLNYDDPETVVYRLGDNKNKKDHFVWPEDVPFLKAIAKCETLQCVRDAHQQPKQKGQFNFPHFLILGWAKSATTSLHGHLVQHPQILKPSIKELHYVDKSCNYTCDAVICDKQATKEFIQDGFYLQKFIDSKGKVAPFEATPNLITLGQHYAPALYELMPWVKLIVHMRDPISRAVSRYVHLLDKRNEGCLAENDLSTCLLNDTDLSDPISGHPFTSYYSRQLKEYLKIFPKEQLHLIQYEYLIGDGQADELLRVKKFIGIDPALPKDAGDILGRSGICRKCKIQPEGWPIEEKVYRQLVEWATVDAQEVARIVDENGFGSGKQWLKLWQKHWDSNLKTCKDGLCSMILS